MRLLGRVGLNVTWDRPSVYSGPTTYNVVVTDLDSYVARSVEKHGTYDPSTAQDSQQLYAYKNPASNKKCHIGGTPAGVAETFRLLSAGSYVIQ